MPQLATIRRHLTALRRRRLRSRWGMAWSAVLITALAGLGVLFALDVGFEFEPARRLLLIAAVVIAMVWSLRRFAWPWWGVRESEAEVALFVEGQHGIDSDLVAALQFDSVAGERWGSAALRDAVVARTVEATRELDWNRGFDRRPLIYRLRWLAAFLAIAVAVSAIWPRHVAVFGVRLLLSERHYPTDTVIERVAVNDQTVLEWNIESARPRDHRLPHGRTVEFVVEVSGQLPAGGSIECRSRSARDLRSVDLRPLAAGQVTALGVTAKPGASYYRGEIPRFVEPFDYAIQLGDATTDLASLLMIQPPLAELSVEVTPPAYASSAREPVASPRQLLVLAGSRVDLVLRPANEKKIQSATIQIEKNGEKIAHPLEAAATPGTWQVPKGTPLASVAGDLKYEVQVVDEDGLGLEAPLHGLIQLKADRPPTVSASIVHRVTLPTARPAVELRLNDDYGLAAAVLRVQCERQPGRATEGTTPADEKFEFPIPLAPQPLVGQNLPHRSQFRLELAKMKLAVGDQLKITLAATDFRGAQPGETTESDPLLLEISDEAGVLAAIGEADERSEKRLNDVIKQQLDVGR